MDLKTIIGSNIFNLRQHYNLTQEEFAEKLDIGVSRSQISRIELGVNAAGPEIIEAVSKAFNVSTDWIFGIKPYMAGLSQDEKELLNSFQTLSTEAKILVLNLIKLISKEKR